MFDITSKTMKKVTEASYLCTGNSFRYRAIIRITYKNYEKMKYWLYKEEIFNDIKTIDGFEKYTIDDLKQDLDSLEIWGNLIAMQDTAKTKTLEEFKNRKFRYQLSPNTIELERTMIKIENVKESSRGSLEVSLIERFRETLEQIKYIEDSEENKIYSWWEMLNRDFKSLNESYKDYISKFYSPKTEELLKTSEFLIFKESFIKYLREFIKGLQINVPNIKYLLTHIDNEEEKVKLIVKTIVNYEKENITLDTEYNENEAYEIHYGRYISMREWFIGSIGSISMADNLLENTSEVIRKITRYALQIVEMQTSGGSRKEEYKSFIDLFNKCKDISEAHKLSAVVFGVMTSKHIACNIERNTENINSSIYTEEPTTVMVKPSNRYREKSASRVSLKEKSEAKKAMAKEILEKRKKEKELIESKIRDNKLIFKDLDNITSEERRVFLSWLSYSLNKRDQGWVKNEYGRYYRVLNPDIKENITIKCEDGNFIMPSYELIFKEEA